MPPMVLCIFRRPPVTLRLALLTPTSRSTMTSQQDPPAVELFTIASEFTAELLSGVYKPEAAVKWYIRVLNAYRKVFGVESKIFEDHALRESLLKRTVTAV